MSEKRLISTEVLARSLSHSVSRMIDEENRVALAAAAIIADQVKTTAEPGHGKDTAEEIVRRIMALVKAAEIRRRIRALMTADEVEQRIRALMEEIDE